MLGMTRAESSRKYQPYFAWNSASGMSLNSAPSRLAEKFCTSMNSSADCDGARGISRLSVWVILLSHRVDPPRVFAGDQAHDLVRLLDGAVVLRDPAVEALLDAAAEQQLSQVVQLRQAECVRRVQLLGELP